MAGAHFVFAFFIGLFWLASPALAASEDDFCSFNASAFKELPDESDLPEDRPRARRVVCADVTALDQMLVYNRFGSHNPFGQIFALTRDLIPANTPEAEPEAEISCADDLGVQARSEGLSPGQVRLRDCKRPRPLTLRANVGDVVHVRVRNFLRADKADGRPGYSETFCRAGGDNPVDDIHGIRELVSEGSVSGSDTDKDSGADKAYVQIGDKLIKALCAAGSDKKGAALSNDAIDWPRTRDISFVIDGLRPLSDPRTGKVNDVCLGLSQLPPGEDFVDCFWHAESEGPYFINSIAAPSGGEGDGGSLTHGLFGSLAVEPQAADAEPTQWYRSQTSQAVFDEVWPPDSESSEPHVRKHEPLNSNSESSEPHVRKREPLDYQKLYPIGGEDLPLLNILKRVGDKGNENDKRYEIVHNELNAIIHEDGKPAFREFSVVFHDELKTFYTRNFEELERFPQLAGVGDGFAINYGASGLGAMVLANRKGIGPGADCMECLYEEFFLESWVNGDPALLEVYADDPSNVHHSYLNDPVVFRNYHAGPKETHVFHLHAHQWFSGNDSGRGSYLDSQTVAPRQGFTYNIYSGGLDKYRPSNREGKPKGWWETLGAGNRNRTVGDSIFHCHLYPHFAQGMWALWRVHDVLEDGSRKLPDGQAKPGLSTELLERNDMGKLDPIKPRKGTVDEDGRYIKEAEGTPIPAVIPLPGQAAPLLPTYAAAGNEPATEGESKTPVPGYPFFIAGKPGHRAPQPPLDIASDDGKNWKDGGLSRHVVIRTNEIADRDTERELGVSVELKDLAIDENTDVKKRRLVEDSLYRATAKMLALGDFSGHLEKASIIPLDNDGEPLERGAMAFHHNGAGLKLLNVYGKGSSYNNAGGYASVAPDAPAFELYFPVNGAPRKPGAPFADPCGAPDAYQGRYPSHNPRPGMMKLLSDPFGSFLSDFVPDPAVTGFRRYQASAVQADIVTNKAGWHDPQGRINVLTADSDRYKTLGPSAREEPFFFRAYSGECIEFRHTNELPKELELDDFQVKTPTDTIGQHIHLVKFDVTAADGSGNGWNYEDGTFAPDEIATRLCAWGATGNEDAKDILKDLESKVRDVLTDEEKADFPEGDSFCDWPPVAKHKIWSLERSRFNFLFQTTVQRWFADPILSIEEVISQPEKDSTSQEEATSQPGKDSTGQSEKLSDRTMRTVFTHDHFGPSSIQQHGFYSALVIEPAGKKICGGETANEENCMKPSEPWTTVAEGGPEGVGTHKIVKDGGDQELHPDYREFALAIADFALLYDPTDSDDDDLIAAAGEFPGGRPLGLQKDNLQKDTSAKGLARLVCEAQHREIGNNAVSDIEEACGSHLTRDKTEDGLKVVETVDVPPAVVARDLIADEEVKDLRQHFAFVRYRAGHGKGLARPVNSPARPESISVDHHDPYLVNYRGEPIPLRIGDTGDDGSSQRKTAFDCYRSIEPGTLKQFSRRNPEPAGIDRLGLAQPGIKPDFNQTLKDLNQTLKEAIIAAADEPGCSIDSQSPDPRGDLAHVYRSEFFDDEMQPGKTDHPESGSASPGEPEPKDASDLLRYRWHGDPVTPLLETYSGERVQIRLIQGAQEVQHTFNIEGLQWRRQIDQKYPAASDPLDTDYSDVTWWQGCRKAGRYGIARQHDRWRSGTLKAGDDMDFWKRHNQLVSHCDNLEGFVSAQEVGISEHFEISTAPSKFNVQFRSVQNPKDDANVDKAGDVRTSDDTASLDYMYHFGSQDAIWNGAWGLMRVHELDSVRDETRRIEAVLKEASETGNQPASEEYNVCTGVDPLKGGKCEIGTSLAGLPQDSYRNSRELEQLPAEQTVACPASAPVVEAYAVAMPLPGGQQYASWRDGFRDPNGLALVHVPEKIVTDWRDKNGNVQSLRKSALPYFRNEPLVIRANAGDCLKLSIVNALTPSLNTTKQACGHDTNGDAGLMTDCLGDAPMPSIVKLNVEPSWSESEDSEDPLHRVQQDNIDIRPSARIAFTTPMSMLTLGSKATLPFGVNRGISVPAGSIQTADYYMGLLRVDWKKIDELLVTESNDHNRALNQCAQQYKSSHKSNRNQDLREKIDTLLASLDAPTGDYREKVRNIAFQQEDSDHREDSGYNIRIEKVRLQAGNNHDGTKIKLPGEFEIQILGGTYWGYVLPNSPAAYLGKVPLPVDDPDVLEDVAKFTNGCIAILLEQETGSKPAEAKAISAIPYAFGAVPLKPVADLFNQLPHGLFGALVVEPQGAVYDGRREKGNRDGSNYEYEPRNPVKLGSAHRGRGANTKIEFTDADGQTRSFREYVLFYQDGLNLWDDRSRNEWEFKSIDGKPLPIVDDCLVCDDTYDLGEKAVSYLAPAFHRRLRQGQYYDVEAHSDLNAFEFRPPFRAQKDSLSSNSLRLWALPGEEVLFRVVHPGGRARQRAFVTVGNDYADLFPDFGFPHSALLAPGKAITAALSAPVRSGCYLWSDGPRMIEAAGAWGLLDVLTNLGQSSCGFLD